MWEELLKMENPFFSETDQEIHPHKEDNGICGSKNGEVADALCLSENSQVPKLVRFSVLQTYQLQFVFVFLRLSKTNLQQFFLSNELFLPDLRFRGRHT